MSRVGKEPIVLPEGVEVRMDASRVFVTGPKGELSARLHSAVRAEIKEEDGARLLCVTLLNPAQASQWGTARAILANLVTGVSEGFSKSLEVSGVGYKASVQGNKLVVSAGYSHEVPFELPEGISAAVEGNVITISGIDKQMVGQIAARIRKIRKPEPYKGKGIKYAGEAIRRKAGKTAKAGE